MISGTVTRAIPPFVTAIALMTVAWFATGPSFGLFLAGLFALAITLPPLVLAQHPMRDRVAASLAIVGGIVTVWCFAVFNQAISVGQWVQCSLVLLGFDALLLGVSSLLAKLQLHRILAAALTVVVATLWLTWPIWLSPTLRDHSTPRLVHWLVQLNPAMAINGVLLQLGPWTQEPMAYHLTDLGQNVAYALPVNGIASIAVHLVVGSGLLLMGVQGKEPAELCSASN